MWAKAEEEYTGHVQSESVWSVHRASPGGLALRVN